MTIYGDRRGKVKQKRLQPVLVAPFVLITGLWPTTGGAQGPLSPQVVLIPPSKDFYVELKESETFTFPVHYSTAMKIQRNDCILGFRAYWLLDCEHNKGTYVNPDMQPPRLSSAALEVRLAFC
jgi:hypothetical protein